MCRKPCVNYLNKFVISNLQNHSFWTSHLIKNVDLLASLCDDHDEFENCSKSYAELNFTGFILSLA